MSRHKILSVVGTRPEAIKIAPVLPAGDPVVLESTSPVGTTRDMAIALQRLRPDLRFPVPSVGGQRIAVDPWFIVHSAPQESRLIRAAREVNDAEPQVVLDEVARAAKAVVNACGWGR